MLAFNIGFPTSLATSVTCKLALQKLQESGLGYTQVEVVGDRTQL